MIEIALYFENKSHSVFVIVSGTLDNKEWLIESENGEHGTFDIEGNHIDYFKKQLLKNDYHLIGIL